MAATPAYDPAVLSVFDALCQGDLNTKKFVYHLESVLDRIIGSKTEDFDAWEENVRDEIERESLASEIRILNGLRSTYIYVQGTNVISRLNSRRLHLGQVRDRFQSKCTEDPL
ncbi:hypothetical protein GSI_08780 [Ganoderma sinense ZZ0214-1]|uniref:Uncharacterized protein n=1 Tax=Ganoderma sinense ZZ0214-1 TaxID=1077348 RepID=A0A2G8S4N4_9APHY|nr:hypothetical protein GSI_08780 [Ganoderma sinense ZZ0214-1]